MRNLYYFRRRFMQLDVHHLFTEWRQTERTHLWRRYKSLTCTTWEIRIPYYTLLIFFPVAPLLHTWFRRRNSTKYKTNSILHLKLWKCIKMVRKMLPWKFLTMVHINQIERLKIELNSAEFSWIQLNSVSLPQRWKWTSCLLSKLWTTKLNSRFWYPENVFSAGP